MICPFYDSFSVPIVGPRGARRTAMPVVPQSSRAPLPRGSWAGAPACPRCRKRNQAAGDEAQKTEIAPASSLPPSPTRRAIIKNATVFPCKLHATLLLQFGGSAALRSDATASR